MTYLRSPCSKTRPIRPLWCLPRLPPQKSSNPPQPHRLRASQQPSRPIGMPNGNALNILRLHGDISKMYLRYIELGVSQGGRTVLGGPSALWGARRLAELADPRQTTINRRAKRGAENKIGPRTMLSRGPPSTAKLVRAT